MLQESSNVQVVPFTNDEVNVEKIRLAWKLTNASIVHEMRITYYIFMF